MPTEAFNVALSVGVICSGLLATVLAFLGQTNPSFVKPSSQVRGVHTRQHGCSQRLRDDAEDQCALVDNELRSPQVIFVVPHVTALELRPFDLRQI